jgi:hypothetical protein
VTSTFSVPFESGSESSAKTVTSSLKNKNKNLIIEKTEILKIDDAHKNKENKK